MTEPLQIPVLHFSNEVVRGGAEEHMLLLLKMLNRSRFRPYLVCPAELAESVQPDLPEDVEVIPLALHTPFQLGPAVQFIRILRHRRIGILHSHMFHASLAASPLGRLCRIRAIIETPHVRELWRKGWKESYVVDRMVGRCVDRFVAVSNANGRYLVQEKRLPARKVVVIQNGCDTARFDPEITRPKRLLEELAIGIADPVLVVLARLEPQKGHRVLLDALPAVRREFPAVRLICVGDGGLRSDLQAHTRQLGLEANVHFVGYQSNVPDWLAMADLSVLPSFYEGLPLAAIESLAAGRPVVATAVDGTTEAVIDGRTGFTVPPGDSLALAEAICHMLRDPQLRAAMSRSGRRLVLDRFTQQQQVDQTEQLYLSAYRNTGEVSKEESSAAPALQAHEQ